MARDVFVWDRGKKQNGLREALTSPAEKRRGGSFDPVGRGRK